MANDESDAPVYLHGDLGLKIIEARCLPNMDMVSERFRRCFVAFSSCRSDRSRLGLGPPNRFRRRFRRGGLRGNSGAGPRRRRERELERDGREDERERLRG
ncbi:hypothetical protein SLA2020_279290 [Shorea laevis]